MSIDTIVSELTKIIMDKADFNLVNMQNPIHILRFPAEYTPMEKALAFTILKDKIVDPLMRSIMGQVEENLLDISEEDWAVKND